ncbi:MAG: 4Fe-4S binding protein [Oscillospiraceae bacterium]
MDKHQLLKIAEDFCDNSALNFVGEDWGVDERLIGMRLLDKPIMKIGRADDPWFEDLRAPAVVGPQFKLPNFWLEDAKRVITLFLPLSKEIRDSNRGGYPVPSLEWVIGRVEGQRMVNALGTHLKEAIIAEGYKAVQPCQDERFVNSQRDAKGDIPPFNSNWSIRHVAFVCGLGTFGIHDCIITEKGSAGRLLSLVTNMDLEPDERDYSDRFEYCLKCRKCVPKCPYEAIKPDGYKDALQCHTLQSFYNRVFNKPRLGCGKCLVDIPCESRRPGLPA